MREYEPKYPLEVLDRVYYPNLLKDSNNVVLSENITYFVSTEKLEENKILKEIESRVRQDCRNAEVAYHDSSGNRWIFLVLNKNQNEPILRRMQAVYKKLYGKISTQIQ
jgi:hypothetical protein